MRYRLLVLLPLFLTACGGEGTNSIGPTPLNVPFSTTDLRTGSGTQAQNGNRVTVHYTGWLYSTSAADNKGQQFDSSAGREPLSFVVGAGNVIRGF